MIRLLTKTKYQMKIIPYIFIMPALIFAVIFFYYPALYSFYLSFTNFRIGIKSEFVGIDNFVNLFKDDVFLFSLNNQMVITAISIFKFTIFPLIAAEIIHFIQNKFVKKIIRNTFVLPMLVPAVVMMFVWSYIYDPEIGLFNKLLDIANLSHLRNDWLGNTNTALISIVMVGFPFVAGMFFLNLSSALQTIPSDIGESARLDGCTSLKIFWHIHLPALLPFLSSLLTFSIIISLQDYVTVLIMTNGGPGYATYIPALHMYKTAFNSQEMGYASSMGIIIFAIIMILYFVNLKVSSALSRRVN